MTSIKVTMDGKDITNLITTVTLSGSKTNVSRTLEFGIASSPTDSTVPIVKTVAGAEVVYSVEQKKGEYKEIFKGLLYDHELGIDSDEIPCVCYDCLYPLVKSEVTYNFKQQTPGQITKQIMDDLGVPFSGCVVEGSPIDRLFEGVNAYDAVMTAWSIQSQLDGKMYIPVVRDGKACIIEKGKTVGKYILEPKSSIINATYKESAADVVSVVNLYDESNNQVGEVKLKDNPLPVNIYKSYKHSDDKEDAQTAALKLLQGIAQSANVNILGDVECLTGRAVLIKEPYTGLFGLFYIDGDTHIFENHMYKSDLELAFENTMDLKDVGGLEQEEVLEWTGEEGFSGMTGSTNQQKIWSFFKSKGFSDAAIAGIIGNLMQESGLKPGTVQGGGRGPGHGLLQWEGGRLTQLKDYAKSKGKAWSDLQTQLEFAYMEMTGTGGVDKYSSTLWKKYGGFEAFKKTGSVRDATRIFEAVMERAGRPMMADRYKYAESAYKELKDWNPAPTSGSSSAGGTGSIARNNSMINYAKTRMGDRYVYGADSRGGAIDCSGLVWRAMQATGYKGGRFSTRDMHGMANRGILKQIPMSQVQPGDIMWMSGHTGLYYGNGKTLEATPPKVGIYSFNYQKWTKAFRYVG